jgi:hypothetical protein
MITDILNMLRIDDFYGKSDNIEIAKGRYKLPTTVKDVFKQAKRERKYIKTGFQWKSTR